MPVTFAVHNLCHDLGKQAVKEDLNKSAEHASVGLIQERSFDAGKAAFSDFRDRDGIAAYVPDGWAGRNPIWWKTEPWSSLEGTRGYLKTHEGREGISPDRGFVWQGLRRDNGTTVLVINTHCINGYAKSGPDAPGHQDYRDESAKKHWNKGHDLIRDEIQSGAWDTILVGGDWNCAWSDKGQPWYPGPKLADLVRTPRWTGSIMVGTLTKSSSGDVVDSKCESLSANSDHDIKVVAVDL